MFKKLDGMLVRKKMITGYLIVIVLMVFSGILAIVGETILLRNLSNYSNKVQRADTAVQMCRCTQYRHENHNMQWYGCSEDF